MLRSVSRPFSKRFVRAAGGFFKTPTRGFALENGIVMPGIAKKDMEFTTIVDMFTKTCEINANNELFGTRVGDKFEWMTYRQFETEVTKFRNVLKKHDFGKGDKVSVIVNNRVEWAVVALAANTLGGYIVPMYEQMLESDWRYIIEDSESKIVVVANDSIYDTVKGYVGTVGNVSAMFSLDACPTAPHSYKRWMSAVADEPPTEIYHPSPDDITTLIYTSGTTGKPKGVELMHSNIVSNIVDKKPLYDHETEGGVSLAFLPW